MNFITKGLNRLKANTIYSERGFDFDKESTSVDEINSFALEKRGEDKLLAFDYLLFNYYYSPCAYTACNLIAGYVDFFSTEEEYTEGLPTFDFIESVGKYLEKASKYSDVFESKEYFLTLAQFYLLQSVDNINKAFNLLNSVPTAYIDEDVQYLTGAMYFLLGMKEISAKMLEGALNSNDEEIKASSSLLLVKCGQVDEERSVELLGKALLSKKTAIITEAISMLSGLDKFDIISKVDSQKLISVMNGNLCYMLATAYNKVGDSDKLDALLDGVQGDELFEKVIESVKNGESVDVDELTISINQKRMEDIADSEMYKYSDVYTRRMLNNEIMETAQENEDFSELDYIALIPCYVK